MAANVTITDDCPHCRSRQPHEVCDLGIVRDHWVQTATCIACGREAIYQVPAGEKERKMSEWNQGLLLCYPVR